MTKKRVDTGPWRWPGKRVLVEDQDLERGLATAWALRRAGYSVAICRGPDPDEYCPLVGSEDCALVVGADAVVAGIGPEIEEAVRRRHPSTPVIAPGSPETVVEAVAAAIGGR